MPKLLFNLLFIVFLFFVFKYLKATFQKVNKELKNGDEEDRDDPDDAPDGASRAQLELEKQWRQAAQRISCDFDPGADPRGKDASISGRFSGHAVTIRRFGRTYVRYFVAFRRAPAFQVCVVRDLETIAERILDGHPVFPSKKFFSTHEPFFYCSAENEEAFRRFLDVPSNRSAVLNLVRLFPAGMFNTEGVSVRVRATVPDVSVISGMAAIADALENPADTPMPDLLTASKKVPFFPLPAEDSPPIVPAASEEKTPKRFPPLQIDVEESPARKTSRIQIRKQDSDLSRRTTQIRIAPPDRRGHEPDAAQDSIVRISDRTPSPAKPAAPVVAPAKSNEKPASPEARIPVSAEKPMPSAESGAPAPEQSRASASSSPDSSLTVDSVCAALFTKSFPGAEERAAFDAMKGRRVRWSGELATVLPFSMDFVFGTRKGVKATILLRRTTQGPAGFQIQIKAVAAFPPELRSALDAAKGKAVVFEGELLKFEPFAREIYLQDASLVS